MSRGTHFFACVQNKDGQTVQVGVDQQHALFEQRALHANAS